ncbi:MAG: hypothetical protein P8M25_14720 [Paracoccaceae bacterium]|nr:hypothetical protein [Paracoccaceae bacterium]
MSLAAPKRAKSALQGTSNETMIEQIKRDGVSPIGLLLFVPHSMRSNNSDLIGDEIKVGRKMTKDMGVEVVPTAWHGIILTLVYLADFNAGTDL